MELARVETLDGAQMQLRLAGDGAWTILLDAGWAHWSPVWARAQASLAETHRTCSFDRLGLGNSDLGAPPRTSFQIVDELQAALSSARLSGPFIYVGHSFGSVHARVLAHRDPSVRAIVMVDPVVEALGVSPPFRQLRDTMIVRFRKLHRIASLGLLRPGSFLLRQPAYARKLPKAARKDVRRGLQPSVLSTVLGELSALEGSMEELRGLGAPKIPFSILSASADWLPGKGADQSETRVQAMHRKLAESVPHGSHVVIPSTSHDLHIDAPEAVVEAVTRVIAHA